MPFKQRLLVFVVLWLLPGLVYAIFTGGRAEAGDSQLLHSLRFVYLAPLITAMGVAFTLVHRDYDTVNAAWQQRGHSEAVVVAVVGLLLLAAFAVHAVLALTRKTRRQFIVLSVIQLTFLSLSIPCVLYFFHYETTHGNG